MEDKVVSTAENLSENIRPLSILIMEDDEIVWTLMQSYLCGDTDYLDRKHQLGHLFSPDKAPVRSPSRDEQRYVLQWAKTGEEGLSMLLDAAVSGQPFDLATIDFYMPPGLWDGAQTVAKIRAHWPKLPLLLVSSMAFDRKQQQSFQQQDVAVVNKPLIRQEFRDSIEAVAKRIEK